MKKTVRFIGWEHRHENSLSLGAVSSQWQRTSGCFQLAYISADQVSLLTGEMACPDNRDMDSGISSGAQMWPMGWNHSWVRDVFSFAAKPTAVFVECWLTRLFENKKSGTSLKVIFLIQEKMTNYQGPLVPHEKLSESRGLLQERKKVLLEASVHLPSLQAWFQRGPEF